MRKEILIIEERKPMRFLFQTIFKNNFNVVFATDALHAMVYLKSGKLPSLILHDIQTSDISGWEFVKQLSISHFYKKIPLVVISSEEESIVGPWIKEYRVIGYFTKPFSPVNLLKLVDAQLNGIGVVRLLRENKVAASLSITS